MDKKYGITLILKCTELPRYAYLIPLCPKAAVNIDNIYNPKELIWNKEKLFNLDDSVIEFMVKEIYEYDLGSKQDQTISF